MSIMSNKYPKFRAAAVQAAPVFLDLDATVEKACSIISEAAENGARLIGFPEAFIPGYPWWAFVGSTDYSVPYYVRLVKNAVEIPSLAVQKISECARANRVYVCVSVNEKDGGSLYLTQLWFSPEGDLIGKHRKLVPTNAERSIWGRGDGSMMPVFETELGNLGGLMCFEHLVPLNILAMNSLNEQVHVGSWPAFVDPEKHLFSTIPSETSSKYYALSTQSFVIMCSQIYTKEMEEMLLVGTNDVYRNPIPVGRGGCTKIYNPYGNVISEPLPDDEEGIAYAEINLEEIIACKYIIDPAGHYSAPGTLSANFNRDAQPVVRKTGAGGQDVLTFEELQGAGARG